MLDMEVMLKMDLGKDKRMVVMLDMEVMLRMSGDKTKKMMIMSDMEVMLRSLRMSGDKTKKKMMSDGGNVEDGLGIRRWQERMRAIIKDIEPLRISLSRTAEAGE
jgi:hypothetical protein